MAAALGGYGGWQAVPLASEVREPPGTVGAGVAPQASEPEASAPVRTLDQHAADSAAQTAQTSDHGAAGDRDGWPPHDLHSRGPASSPARAPSDADDEASNPVVDQPAHLTLPAIDTAAPLVPLGLQRDGSLEVPSDYDTAGWWEGGAAPGEPGPAVIAGHVDSHSSPAVFAALDQLSSGDRVEVHGASGETAMFQVSRVEQHPKDAFPTEDVYGDTDRPTLRLITCGGPFDDARGRYDDNVIVYAEQAQPAASGG